MENSLLPDIRLRKVTMTNFRNIEFAEVDFPNGKISDLKEGKSSVLGIYGQNGSGKTSVIMALNALKKALSGWEFDDKFWPSCIRAGCKHARLEYELTGHSESGVTYDIYYGFSMAVENKKSKRQMNVRDVNDASEMFGFGRMFSDSGTRAVISMLTLTDKRIVIFDEKLEFASSSENGKKLNKQVLIDTSEKACKEAGKAFGNKTKYEKLTARGNSDIDEFLYEEKIEAKRSALSFIFSENVVDTLIKSSEEESYKTVLESLSKFGKWYLIVIMMDSAALSSIKLLPLFIWFSFEKEGAAGGIIPISVIGNSQVEEDQYELVEKAIESISNVISTIVPGLALEINDIGKTLSEAGEDYHMFELVSNRDGIRIPLAFESDGIRRIVSFTMALVAAYNNPSVTLAIDELDSGIFEYMLGELISIMNESAQGQLVFTSHNLRPLEVLPFKNLLFTTVNPEKRFSRLEGISGNNNLRDSYFRSVALGSGKDAFYNATDKFNIEQALFEAGLPLED